MKRAADGKPYYARTTYRFVTGVFGLALVGMGLYVLLLPGADSVFRAVAGLCLAALGGNMLLSAIRATASWLSKVGPLP